MAEIEAGYGRLYDAAACDAVVRVFRDKAFTLSEWQANAEVPTRVGMDRRAAEHLDRTLADQRHRPGHTRRCPVGGASACLGEFLHPAHRRGASHDSVTCDR